MHQKNRKILLFSILIAFLIAGAYLIISTQGLVFDLASFSFTKTGAIFIKFTPSDAEVFINNKKIEKTPGIINRGIFLKNFTPDTYSLSIRKNGFIDWEKQLTVEPGLVSAISTIKLWPIKTEKDIFATTTNHAVLIANDKLITRTDENLLSLNGRNMRSGRVVDFNESADYLLTKNENGLFFAQNITDTYSAINLQELFVSLKNRQLNLRGNVPIKYAAIHPFSPEKVILATGQALYAIDIKKVQIEQITNATSSIDFIALNQNEIFGISKTGFVQGAHLILKNTFSFRINAPTEINSITVGEIGEKILFTDENNGLFIYDRKTNSTEKIAEHQDIYSISPNEKIVMWMEKGKLWLYCAEKDEGDLKMPRGTKIQLNTEYTFAEKNLAMFWMKNIPTQLFLKADNKFFAIELDPRGTTNATIIEKDFDNLLRYKETFFSVYKKDGSEEIYKLNIK